LACLLPWWHIGGRSSRFGSGSRRWLGYPRWKRRIRRINVGRQGRGLYTLLVLLRRCGLALRPPKRGRAQQHEEHRSKKLFIAKAHSIPFWHRHLDAATLWVD